MAEIINQIPGFENGIVHHVSAADEVDALFLSAQIISDLLNKWNTSVAFFSLDDHSEGLKRLVENNSTVARLCTVNQKNHSLQVILRKAKGMVNRKFVRAIIIEGLTELDAVGKRWLEQQAQSTHTSIVVVDVKDDENELACE